MEVVEIDHSLLPFYVLDNEYRLPVGLPWLTSAIDVYSQTVVGYYLTFDPPSYLSVMYCLLHSIRSKEYVRSTYKSVKNNWAAYGLMETLKVDNGTDFRGKSLEDACRELKINLEFCPVRTPWYKATIERYFGGIQQQLSGKIPGSCAKFLEENDYDPKKQAVITLNELQEIIHVFLIDIHNQNSHTKLKSTRASVWNHGIQSYPISLPSSDETLKVLLGDVEERTISRKGIEFYYLFYNSDRLQELRDRYEAGDFRRRDKIRGKEKAKFKYNRNDISVIHVLDPQTREYVAVPAINQNYTQDLSLVQHRIIHRFALNHGFIQGGKNVDVVALALAKQEIQNIVNNAIKKTKAGKTTIYKTYAQNYPRQETDEGSIVPIIYTPIPVPATVKGLVEAILKKLGDPLYNKGTTTNQTSRAYDLLAACKVELIVLDEFHHFIDRESKRVLKNVCDWLKNLILNTRIPVVLFGLPESKRILEVDNWQLSRRFTYRHELIPFPYNEAGIKLFHQFLSDRPV